MPPPKKKVIVRGTRLQLEPEPPDIQDVLNEIEDIKGTLGLIQYSIEQIKQQVSDLSATVEERDEN